MLQADLCSSVIDPPLVLVIAGAEGRSPHYACRLLDVKVEHSVAAWRAV